MRLSQGELIAIRKILGIEDDDDMLNGGTIVLGNGECIALDDHSDAVESTPYGSYSEIVDESGKSRISLGLSNSWNKEKEDCQLSSVSECEPVTVDNVAAIDLGDGEWIPSTIQASSTPSSSVTSSVSGNKEQISDLSWEVKKYYTLAQTAYIGSFSPDFRESCISLRNTLHHMVSAIYVSAGYPPSDDDIGYRLMGLCDHPYLREGDYVSGLELDCCLKFIKLVNLNRNSESFQGLYDNLGASFKLVHLDMFETSVHVYKQLEQLLLSSVTFNPVPGVLEMSSTPSDMIRYFKEAQRYYNIYLEFTAYDSLQKRSEVMVTAITRIAKAAAHACGLSNKGDNLSHLLNALFEKVTDLSEQDMRGVFELAKISSPANVIPEDAFLRGYTFRSEFVGKDLLECASAVYEEIYIFVQSQMRKSK